MRKIALLSFIIILLTFVFSGCDYIGKYLNPTTEDITEGKLPDKATWLKSASADTIARIDIRREYYGVAPGSLVSCYYSENKDAIEEFIAYLSTLDIERVSSDILNGMNGGGGKNIVFTFSDGTRKTIKIRHGYYCEGSDIFNISSSNTSTFENASEQYLRFMVSKNSANVYTNTDEPTLVGQLNNLASLNFRKITIDGTTIDNATHYIDTDFREIYILSETTFCYMELNKIHCYELIDGQSFYELITENQ